MQNHEHAFGSGSIAMQFCGQIQSTLLWAVPRSWRPALHQGKKANLVSCVRILVNIHATRAGGDKSEGLNGNVALLQPGADRHGHGWIA